MQVVNSAVKFTRLYQVMAVIYPSWTAEEYVDIKVGTGGPLKKIDWSWKIGKGIATTYPGAMMIKVDNYWLASQGLISKTCCLLHQYIFTIYLHRKRSTLYLTKANVL